MFKNAEVRAYKAECSRIHLQNDLRNNLNIVVIIKLCRVESLSITLYN